MMFASDGSSTLVSVYNLTNAVYLVVRVPKNGSIGDRITIFQRVDFAEVAVAATDCDRTLRHCRPSRLYISKCAAPEPHIGKWFRRRTPFVYTDGRNR